ncbi:ABC transporter ATP-binding protein [Fodinicurvata halophila]|uniref:ABC transporter ATP-binding protein n=1 Tax=Fodinicurvata halophila TaxID=1419723 RepID=A0ABV8UH89_9PROT
MKIEANAITQFAGPRAIVDGVDLTMEPGMMTGLIGPNGAGKTTLLRILAGIQQQSRGSVHYDGCASRELSLRCLARKVAFLAQAGEVNWALTVERLVELGRLPHRTLGVPGQVDAAAVHRAMQATEVLELRQRMVSTLSGGERMRVLLARALAVEARALLADEPVTALDPYHQIHVMELLRQQADSGMTIAVVLHDLTLAHRYCDRLVLMDAGVVLAEGPPSEVLSDANMASAYGVHLQRGQGPGGEFVLPWSCIDQPTTSKEAERKSA